MCHAHRGVCREAVGGAWEADGTHSPVHFHLHSYHLLLTVEERLSLDFTQVMGGYHSNSRAFLELLGSLFYHNRPQSLMVFSSLIVHGNKMINVGSEPFRKP